MHRRTKRKLNKQLADTQPIERDNATITEWIKTAAEEVMTKKVVTRHPFELSEETIEHMDTKRRLLQEGKSDPEIKDIRKQVSRSIRKDKILHTINMISHEVDERDQYMGLRCLRRPFSAIPLGIKDTAGKHIPFDQRAQRAEEFLGSTIWGGQPEISASSEHAPEEEN